jgi:hypothetical protein
MHAWLNAISVGTPAGFWAYSRKFAPLLADGGWHHGFDLRSDSDVANRTLALLDGVGGARDGWGLESVRAAASARVQLAVDELRRTLGCAE